MATNWKAAFNSIRWAKVLDVAPAIAQRAAQLWKGIAKHKPPAGTPLLPGAKVYSSDPAIAAVEKQVHALEMRAERLREDIVTSSEIIDKLAEQQSELVQAVDALRGRTRALLVFCVLLGVALFGALGFILNR